MEMIGEYRITKVMSLPEDGFGLVYIPIDDAIAREKDDHDRLELQRLKNWILTIYEDGSLVYGMDIPEGIPEEEIKKAEKIGRIKDGRFILEEQQGKIEDGEIYMHDERKMLTGEEWVKISTEDPNIISNFTYIFEKIK